MTIGSLSCTLPGSRPPGRLAQQMHLAWLSGWNCLCDRPVFGAVGPCRTVRAVHHDGNMSAVQWGTVSTWVAAVGTVAAVSLALWGARGERKERLRRELRQQAVRISAWFVEMHKDSHGEDSRGEAWLPPELQGRVADVELLNNSADPVTDVLIFLSRGSPAMSRVMVVVSFTDSAGNHWARGARGELRQLPAPAIEYWKVHTEDIDWRVPARLD
jgi:hypothetical protein